MILAEAHTHFSNGLFVWEMQEGKNFSSSPKKCSDYYPFGLTMPGRSSNSANPNDNYKFTGHERDDEAGLNLDYMGARYYDPSIARFMSIDPLASKRSWVSPYNYAQNNPLNRIDPTGMLDIYVFDQEGNFTGDVIPQEGEHIGRVVDSNGGSYDFEFADPVSDPAAIDKGAITNLVIPSDTDINQTMNNAGVFSEEAQKNPKTYLWNESRSGNGRGAGKLDFTTELVPINGKKQLIDKDASLYLTSNKAGTIAHNGSNYGNFLWGAATKALGVWETTAKTGAHLDALYNVGEPDTKDDQKSILTGRQQVTVKN